MSFAVPDIPFAGLDANRPAVRTAPSPDQLQYLVDLDRSTATHGRMIWGFGRGTKATNPAKGEHPTEPLTVTGDTFRTLTQVLHRIPPLGSGPANPSNPGGNFVVQGYFLTDSEHLRVGLQVTNHDDLDATALITPTPDYDASTGLMRFQFELDPDVVVPGDLCSFAIEVRDDDDDTSHLWAGCLVFSDIDDIEPPEPAGFLPSPENMYAAFSLRKVVESYTGPCIEITRESDEETLDVGFDAEGNADTAAMLAFLDSENDTLRVTKWYDQGPNGRDAVPEGVLSTQGRIYLGAGTSVSGDISTGLQYRDGVLGVLYTHGMGNGQLATTADGNSIEEFTIFLVQRRDDDFGAGSGTRGFAGWFHTNASFIGYNRGSSGGVRDRFRPRFAGVTSDAPAGKFEQWDTTQLMCDSMFSDEPSDDWFVHRNGEFVNTEERTATYQLSRIWLGRTNASGSQPRGWLTEGIFYEKQFSTSEREDIEESIMDHYGITPVPDP